MISDPVGRVAQGIESVRLGTSYNDLADQDSVYLIIGSFYGISSMLWNIFMPVLIIDATDNSLFHRTLPSLFLSC